VVFLIVGCVLMISFILIKKILSLFLIMALGVAAVRTKMLKSDDSKVISLLMLYIIMPCVILSSYQIEYSEEILEGLIIALIAGIVFHVGMLLLNIPLTKIFRLSGVESCSTIYSNAANLVVPLVTSIFGKEWVIYTSAFVSVQQVLMWSHGKMMICGERKIDFRKIILNVNMIAIALGVITFLLRIQFPEFVRDGLDAASSSFGPLAMIVMGMLIGNMSWKKVKEYRRIWIVAAIRLIFYPLLGVLFLKLSGLAGMAQEGETILMISLFALSTSPAATVTQLAQIYGKDADYASAINVVCTILCIITMPLIVMIYQL